LELDQELEIVQRVAARIVLDDEAATLGQRRSPQSGQPIICSVPASTPRSVPTLPNADF
jgi:hypothetical protein